MTKHSQIVPIECGSRLGYHYTVALEEQARNSLRAFGNSAIQDYYLAYIWLSEYDE